MSEYKIQFDVELKTSEPYDLPTGTMCYDGYTAEGVRILVVDAPMDSPMIWRNAIIVSKGMVV
jgi:hypothetical protein